MQTLRLTRAQHAVEGHPYLRLLRLYLERYLPRDDSAAPAAAMKGVLGPATHSYKGGLR